MFLSGSTYVTYEDGSRADIATGVYNHHIAVVDVGKTNIAPFDCKWNMTALFEGMSSGYLASASTMGGAKPAGGMGGGGKAHGRVANSDPMKKAGGSDGFQSLLKRQIGLPGSPVSQIFGSGDDGSAQNFYSIDPSFKSGYYIGKKDIILHTSELINYKNTTQKVYITADVEYIPGKPEGWSDAVMGAVSAVGCMPFGYCKFSIRKLSGKRRKSYRPQILLLIRSTSLFLTLTTLPCPENLQYSGTCSRRRHQCCSQTQWKAGLQLQGYLWRRKGNCVCRRGEMGNNSGIRGMPSAYRLESWRSATCRGYL
jgi:hypothetical protein